MASSGLNLASDEDLELESEKTLNLDDVGSFGLADEGSVLDSPEDDDCRSAAAVWYWLLTVLKVAIRQALATTCWVWNLSLLAVLQILGSCLGMTTI